MSEKGFQFRKNDHSKQSGENTDPYSISAHSGNNSTVPNSSLFNFLVFDSVVEDKEGAINDVFYAYSTDSEFLKSSDKKILEAGILTTFIFFCENFKADSPCGYIYTGKREISLLPIGEGVFFSASILSKYPTHRLVLNSVLKTIRNILYLNVQPPKRNGIRIDERFRTRIKSVMPMIISVTRWNDLVFTELWDAILPINGLPKPQKDTFQRELIEIHNKNDFVYGLILTVRDKVICHTAPDPELARLLALLVYSKFSLYFPRKLKKKENVLQWIIGFSIEANGTTNIFTPPIIWNGRSYALAALRYNKTRLILVIDPKKTDLEMQLKEFSRGISSLVLKSDHLDNPTTIPKKTMNNLFGRVSTGVKLAYKVTEKELILLTNNIQQYDYNSIEEGVLKAHEVALSTAGNGKVASGIFPSKNGYFAYFDYLNATDKPQKHEKIVMMKMPKQKGGISDGIKELKFIADENEEVVD